MPRAELAGALLHDCGKLDSGLGTLGRVGATVSGSIAGSAAERATAAGLTRRIGLCYARHEAIGAQMLLAAGSDPVTVPARGSSARSARTLPTLALTALPAADDTDRRLADARRPGAQLPRASAGGRRPMAVLGPFERRRRPPRGPCGADGEQAGHLARIGGQLGVALLHRAQHLDDGLAGVRLERPVLACSRSASASGVVAGGRREDRQQVGHAGLGRRGRSAPRSPESVTARLNFARSPRARRARAPCPGATRSTSTSSRRVLQVHHPRAGRRDGGLGHDERVAVAGVEPDGEVAGELDVLALVVAHGHPVGVVEEDVGRLQRRVGEQAGGDELRRLRPTCP